MAWKWYDITNYKASVGSIKGNYYGEVQLFGDGFYASIRFHKDGPLPNSSAPTTYGQRFYGNMYYEQLQMAVDLLRNEEPVRFGWYVNDPNLFRLMTGKEPVGEGDGTLAEDSE